MQQVLSVLWSLDNKFVLSGSDEMNIRLWKANASEKLGPVCFLLVLHFFKSFLGIILVFYKNLRFRLIYFSYIGVSVQHLITMRGCWKFMVNILKLGELRSVVLFLNQFIRMFSAFLLLNKSNIFIL